MEEDVLLKMQKDINTQDGKLGLMQGVGRFESMQKIRGQLRGR